MAICSTWQNFLGIENCHEQISNVAAISAIGWSIDQAFAVSGFVLIDNGASFLWLLPIFFWIWINFKICQEIIDSSQPGDLVVFDSKEGSLIFCRLLIWLFICSIPMYLIGWDWGRFFAVQSCLLISCFLILQSPSLLLNVDSKIRRIYSTFHLPNSWVISVFWLFEKMPWQNKLPRGLFVISLFVGVPHCCITLLGLLSKGVLGAGLNSVGRIVLIGFHS